MDEIHKLQFAHQRQVSQGKSDSQLLLQELMRELQQQQQQLQATHLQQLHVRAQVSILLLYLMKGPITNGS